MLSHSARANRIHAPLAERAVHQVKTIHRGQDVASGREQVVHVFWSKIRAAHINLLYLQPSRYEDVDPLAK